MSEELEVGSVGSQRAQADLVQRGPCEPVAIARERDAVTQVVREFLDAFAMLDWEAFRAHFADDAAVFFPLDNHPQRADGREQIEQLFRGVFEHARAGAAGPPYLNLHPHDVSIRQSGDRAVVSFHLHDPGILCRRTLALQRTAYDWKIVHLHASNLPAPNDLEPHHRGDAPRPG